MTLREHQPIVKERHPEVVNVIQELDEEEGLGEFGS
jgi:hypothetical protein